VAGRTLRLVADKQRKTPSCLFGELGQARQHEVELRVEPVEQPATEQPQYLLTQTTASQPAIEQTSDSQLASKPGAATITEQTHQSAQPRRTTGI